MKKLASLIGVLSLSAALGGCMFHGGSPQYVSNTTLGEELTALQLALEEGAITESEYQSMKEDLIASGRWKKGEKASHHGHHKQH